jgi:purine-binding chemotaxis protein CheW
LTSLSERETLENAVEEVSLRESDVRPSLVCRVKNRLCALPLESVIETMRPLPIEPIAGAPESVRGVSVVRGQPIPVVNAARLFDDEDSRPARFVTLRVGERMIAIAVDEVVGIRGLSTAALDQVPGLLKAALSDVVSAIGALDAELLMVLNGVRLVPEAILNPPAAELAEP